MEAIPRKYGEWGQFDRYCKLVVYHEAIDYLREFAIVLSSIKKSNSFSILIGLFFF